MSTELDCIFMPKSIAVVGASNKPGKWGYGLVRSIVGAGYQGKLYPVNPRESIVQGIPAYPSIKDIDAVVDLAVIGVPAGVVPSVVADCATKGVRGLIVVAAGFGEKGSEGKALESTVATTLRESGMRMVGPNCVGIISSSGKVNTTPHPFTTGGLAFITQSGNMIHDVEYASRTRGLGFSKMVSLGNQLDIQFHEYIDYVRNDSDTRVILLYVEQIKDGAQFMKVVRETIGTKPVLAIKVGETETGVRAAKSHTGALTGSYKVYQAAFRQMGIVTTSDSNDLADIAEAFLRVPSMHGKRIVVLTDGGGHGAMACDAAHRLGLQMPVLDESVQSVLREVLLPQSIVMNPVDFVGAAEADLWNFPRVMDIILSQPDIDGLLIVGALFGAYAEMFGGENLEMDVARAMCDLSHKHNKPVIMHCPYPVETSAALQTLRNGGIPAYTRVETAARCMAALADYAATRERFARTTPQQPSGKPGVDAEALLQTVITEGRSTLLETEARQLLSLYGVDAGASRFARTKASAIRAAKELGFPVVAKLVSPQILHKSDAGGVKLNLRSGKQVSDAYDSIMTSARKYAPEANLQGVLLTPMLRGGVETIIGAVRDPQFGPVVMFGLGGVFVEVMGDVAYRIPPVTDEEVHAMLREIKGFPLLQTARGSTPRDLDALVAIVQTVARIMLDNPRIVEIDLNPVLALEKGAAVLDARVVLS